MDTGRNAHFIRSSACFSSCSISSSVSGFPSICLRSLRRLIRSAFRSTSCGQQAGAWINQSLRLSPAGCSRGKWRAQAQDTTTRVPLDLTV